MLLNSLNGSDRLVIIGWMDLTYYSSDAIDIELAIPVVIIIFVNNLKTPKRSLLLSHYRASYILIHLSRHCTDGGKTT